MLVAVIQVTLTRKQLTEDQLRDLIMDIYSDKQPPQAQQRHTSKFYRHFQAMLEKRIYACMPEPFAIASFVWMSKHDFSVVIEPSPKGRLIRCVENVMRAVLTRLKQHGLKAQFSVSIESIDSGRTYLWGEPNAFGKRLMDALQDNLALIIIGAIVAVIAKFGINDYFAESIAGLISLSLISLWETGVVWHNCRERLVAWRVNDYV